MVRYLLDELNTYEEDHSDALCPVQRFADESHAGEAALVAPLSADETRRLFHMQTEANRDAVHKAYLLAASYMTRTGSSCSCAVATASPASSLRVVSSGNSTWQPPELHTTSTNLTVSQHAFNTDFARNRRGILVPLAPMPGFGLVTSVQNVTSTNTRVAPSDPSRVIPQVPRGSNGWKVVIQDWENADPSRSLVVPLRDWDESWHSGSRDKSKTFGVLYHQRSIIAKEFIETYVPRPLKHPILTMRC